MEPRQLTTSGELREVHTNGVGFVYNDTWGYVHKSSCWRVPLMLPYSSPRPPSVDEGDTRGYKLFWERLEDALEWVPRNRDGFLPKRCSNCNP